MKKANNKTNVALKRSKLIIRRETIAVLAAVHLNGVASGIQLTGTTESVDYACDTTVSTQTH